MKPTWITTSGYLTTATESVVYNYALSASDANTYQLISGELPKGLTISSAGLISGTPTPVVSKVESKFVIRAANTYGVTDRKFIVEVDGKDDPLWSTPAGYLPLGYNGEGYVLTHQFIEYNLAATSQSPDDVSVTYFIAEGNGTLPNGVRLEKNGKLHGYIDVNLAAGSYPVLYEFIVTATDGINDSDRKFKFYLTAPELFSADSTYFVFSSTVLTTTTTVGIIPSGSTILGLTTGINTSFNFSVLSTNTLIFANVSAFSTATKIISYNTNSFTLNKATNASISIGSVLTFATASNIDILSIDSIESSVGYLQPPQFLNGSDLGIVRSNNNESIDVTAYDPQPYRGPVTYKLVTGTSITTQLPVGLNLDTETGYIWGNIPYQPAYTRSYALTVQAVKKDNRYGTEVTATNTFTLAVKGEVESSIEWVTLPDLGSIEAGSISELFVAAKQISSEYTIKYNYVSGTLPPDLTLARDGTLVGTVAHDSSGTYSFTVMATDVYELSAITREFTVQLTQTSNKEYTQVYFRPFFSKEKRAMYSEFINNTFTFDPKLLYRYYDPNFGVQSNIRLFLDFGIERIDLSRYTVALRENYYRKRFYFGEVKKALAKNTAGELLYEVVYVDIVDDMVNNDNKSIARVIYNRNDILYPGSIDNMRTQLQLIPLEDNSYISINEDLSPRYMNTLQPGTYDYPGYMRVVPICYAQPGQGDRIISRIKLSGFDFKLLDFEVDRIVVQKGMDQTSAKYLILDRQALDDHNVYDTHLYGDDWADHPELTVRLDDENDTPLTRT